MASRASLIAPVAVADLVQSPYQFRHCVERHHRRGDIQDGLRRQIGHSGAPHVLHVNQKFTTGIPYSLTAITVGRVGDNKGKLILACGI